MTHTRITAHTVTPGRVEVYKPGVVCVEMSPADARALADDLRGAAARAEQVQREAWAKAAEPSDLSRALNTSFERLMTAKEPA